MNPAPDLERALRRQLWVSIVVTGLIALLAIAATGVVVLRSDLPLLLQIVIPAIFWVWVVHGAWEFRKIYVRLGAAPSDTESIDT